MTVIYKLLSLAFSVLGGMLAGAVFKQVWKVAARREDAPDADDRERSWREVLIAAAVQGAIFGMVKASVQRSGAQAVRKTTGRWPGDD
jgi:predicted metal-dependent enzyme (double-stranded beta helix superfamily)